ncbi:MAG TPA: class I SAM-dependent methyltransferase [Saprospiraceae bacterium]|nr:class I SAM-dependent methyltransferase [Lacibacter sp.]HMO89990.1 class I SAM-dependent methyltransferase [Lacibacter sp.]HMQ08611.1 class I SAM-dependent methyltransferase [Saprospiraceae bacterium]
MNLEDELFCLKYEQDALAVALLTGKSERWVKGFISPGIEQEHLDRYHLACNYTKGKSVLDIACGCGYGSYLMAIKGEALSVDGVDIESEAIRYGNYRYEQKNIKRYHANALEYKPEKLYDVIVSFETVEHIVDFKSYIANLSRWLQNDGTLIISTPIVIQTTSSVANPFHVIEWSFFDFQKLFSDQFNIDEVYLQHVWIKNFTFNFKSRFKRIFRSVLSAFHLMLPPPEYIIKKGKPFEKFTGQYDMNNSFQGFQTLVLRKRL